MGVRPGGRVDEARHVRQTEGPGVRRKRASAERGGGEGHGRPLERRTIPARGHRVGWRTPGQGLEVARSEFLRRESSGDALR